MVNRAFCQSEVSANAVRIRMTMAGVMQTGTLGHCCGQTIGRLPKGSVSLFFSCLFDLSPLLPSLSLVKR